MREKKKNVSSDMFQLVWSELGPPGWVLVACVTNILECYAVQHNQELQCNASWKCDDSGSVTVATAKISLQLFYLITSKYF